MPDTDRHTAATIRDLIAQYGYRDAYSAWVHRNPHWYMQGRQLPTGFGITVNAAGEPELHEQADHA